jgi:hypothetical protein
MKVKDKIKKILKFNFSLINFLILLLYVPFFALKFSFTKKKIFLNTTQGFGHTISNPILLEFYNKDDWILIFGFYKKKHNKLISNIFFKKKLYFFNYDLLSILKIQSIHFKIFEDYLFFFLNFIFQNILKKKTFYFLEYSKFLPINSLNLNNPNYSKITDSSVDKLYWIVHEKKFPQYDLPKFYYDKFNTIFSNLGGNFIMRVGFVLRFKDSLVNNYIPRDTQDIEFYKEMILYMVKNNYQIIFGGDEIDFPSWIYKFGNSIITRKKTRLSLNEYNIFTGMMVDTSIGPHSGSRLFDILKIRKNLILNHSFVGDAFPNSIISYKKNKFKNIQEFKDLIYSLDYYTDQSNQERRQKYLNAENLSQQDSLYIVSNFLENFNNPEYGVLPQSLGINDGVLVDSKARLSPVWLKIVGLI